MNRGRAKLALRCAVSAALIALLYRRVDVHGLGTRLAGLSVPPLAAVFPLLFLNTWISALKWSVLLRADGVRLPMRTLFTNYMIASFFNVFLPSNIGGDSYRIYTVARATSRTGTTVASVLADRLSGFLALSVMGFVFPLAGWESIAHRRMLLLPLAVFGLMVGILLLVCSPRAVHLGLRLTGLGRMEKVRVFADGFLAAIASYRRQPRVLAKAMTISVGFHMTFIVCVWLLARALALPVPFYAFCVYVPLVAILEAVPLSIFGIGLRDAGYVIFMRAMGRPDEDGLALAVLFVTVTLLYCSLGGFLFALRRRAGREPMAAGRVAPAEGAT